MSVTCQIIAGDSFAVLPTLSADSFDACVTDPPYHLTTGKKGRSGEASVNLNSPYGRSRVTTGFMGMKWDGGDIAHRVEFWREVLRVLKPGAHLVAFAGTRTYHRMVCGLEDAGFEIRDQLAWVFGSGFPKSSNQEGQWEGWGTALKPAWEPIVLARKPLVGTVPENLAAHGVGALNIDGCRIESRTDVQGRWPANLCHDGSPEVVGMFPADAGAAAPVTTRNGDKFRNAYGTFAGNRDEQGSTFQGDAGSAARFFYCPKASREDRDAGCEAFAKKPLHWSSGDQNPGSFQSAGTDKSARNPHPTVKPTELMRWLCRLVTPPGGKIIDPFLGSGSTGRAALLEGFSIVGIEREDLYLPIARARCVEAGGELFANVEMIVAGRGAHG